MASLITCTPGGASDNAYIDLTDADAWFANTTRNDAWQSVSEPTRERALIEATRDVNKLGGPRASDSAVRPQFLGAPYDSDLDNQALHFPRTTDTDSSGAVVIPEGIITAVCEQAFWLLQQTSTEMQDGGVPGAGPNAALVDFRALQAEGLRIFSMDGLYVQMDGSGATVPQGIAPAAWEAAKAYVRNGYGLTSRGGAQGYTYTANGRRQRFP